MSFYRQLNEDGSNLIADNEEGCAVVSGSTMGANYAIMSINNTRPPTIFDSCSFNGDILLKKGSIIQKNCTHNGDLRIELEDYYIFCASKEYISIGFNKYDSDICLMMELNKFASSICNGFFDSHKILCNYQIKPITYRDKTDRNNLGNIREHLFIKSSKYNLIPEVRVLFIPVAGYEQKYLELLDKEKYLQFYLTQNDSGIIKEYKNQ